MAIHHDLLGMKAGQKVVLFLSSDLRPECPATASYGVSGFMERREVKWSPKRNVVLIFNFSKKVRTPRRNNITVNQGKNAFLFFLFFSTYSRVNA